MAKELKYRFNVLEDGTIKIIDRKSFEAEMKSNFAGQTIIGIFRKQQKIRTNLQNSFYFGAFVYSQIDCFKERWGEIFTVEQVHDWNKSNVWCKEIIVGDEVVKIPDSSSNKTTVEWEEKLELCRQFFLLNFDWTLPIPNQQSEINYQ